MVLADAAAAAEERPPSGRSNSQGLDPARRQPSASRSRPTSARNSVDAAAAVPAGVQATSDSPAATFSGESAAPVAVMAPFPQLRPPQDPSGAAEAPLLGTQPLQPSQPQGFGTTDVTAPLSALPSRLADLAPTDLSAPPLSFAQLPAIGATAVPAMQGQPAPPRLPENTLQTTAAEPAAALGSPRSSLRLSNRSSAKETGPSTESAQGSSPRSPASPSARTLTRRSSVAMLAVEEAGRWVPLLARIKWQPVVRCNAFLKVPISDSSVSRLSCWTCSQHMTMMCISALDCSSSHVQGS